MLKIRSAKITEVQYLQDLNDEVFIDNAKYDPDLKLDWAQSELGKKYFTELVSDPEQICLIAEDDGKPVGYIAASTKEFSYRLSRYLEIDNMGVIPQYRSKGVGSLLMKKLMEVAKKRGYQKIFVNSYFANTKAIAFYKKNGFGEIDVSLERKIG